MASTQIQEEITREVALLPPTEEQEVLRFVRFLRTRENSPRGNFEHLLTSFYEESLWQNHHFDSPDAIAVEVNKTEGVNGGAASIGSTRIAVWMLEEARREGLSDREILNMHPQLTALHLVMAWLYVATHQREIDQEIQRNDEAWESDI